MARKAREQYAVHVGARGRLVLPAPLRKRLSIAEGDRLVMTLEPDGRVIMASLRQQIGKAQGLYRHVAQGKSLADELIAERRAEAKAE
jgi:AbrB family looped-hinge helix DNA binding protein